MDQGWNYNAHLKGMLITTLEDRQGNKVLYELGRQNIEIATIPTTISHIVGVARSVLDQLYEAARMQGLEPYHGLILGTNEDLLIISDERDATWLELDGREALNLLAKISAVQFTNG